MLSPSLRSILIAISPLGILLGVALALSLGRPLPAANAVARDRVQWLFLLGISAQCLHVIEEFVTGFHRLYPRLLGLSPWSGELFISFNLSWLALWVLAARALRGESRWLLWPAWPVWFFAIAMTVNGLAHPVLALTARGYFPGLLTSPAVGLLGVLLVRRLFSSYPGL